MHSVKEDSLYVRKMMGWTQEETARYFQVSNVTVARWETGKSAKRRTGAHERLHAAAAQLRDSGTLASPAAAAPAAPASPSAPRMQGLKQALTEGATALSAAKGVTTCCQDALKTARAMFDLAVLAAHDLAMDETFRCSALTRALELLEETVAEAVGYAQVGKTANVEACVVRAQALCNVAWALVEPEVTHG